MVLAEGEMRGESSLAVTDIINMQKKNNNEWLNTPLQIKQ